MDRVLLDLKSAAGRDAFLRLAARADVVIESFRPGVVDRLGIGDDAVRAVNPGVVYCSTSGYGQTGHAHSGPDTISTTSRSAATSTAPGAARTAGPALPGATVGDGAGGGMQAVIAILAALVRARATGEGADLDVSVADGVVALMSLYVDEYFATGEIPGPGHNILTGRYACYDVYRCADDRWVAVGAIEPHFFANLCRAARLRAVARPARPTTRVQDAMRADFAAAFRGATARRVGRRARTGRHLRVGGRDRARGRSDPRLPRARGVRRAPSAAGHDEFEQVGWVFAGMDREQPGPSLPRRDRHRYRRAARRGRLLGRRDRETSCGMKERAA